MMHTTLLPRVWIIALSLGSLLVANHASAAKGPERWEPEIRQFEELDKSSPPKPGGILFTGSSSIRMWTTLAADFPNHPVTGRGFGGSEMSDLNHYVDRIVIPYAPRHILVYEGDNDLANGKTPQQVLADFQTFVAKVREKLPRTRIDYIAIKPSRARWHLSHQIRETNRSIAAWGRTQSRVGFIDVFRPMLHPDGRLRGELFREDGLHLNAEGYALWTQVIRKKLRS